MDTRSKIIGAAAGLLVIGAVSVGGALYMLKGNAPAAVSLESALAAAAASNGSVSADTELPQAGASGGSEAEAGAWEVVPAASFVGYRVNEELGGIGAVTAVGRTSSVEGELLFDGDSISEIEVTANLSTLASDRSQRDGALRMQALETSKYPTATFTLSEPIDIASLPAEGQTVTKTVAGELTLHGVTKQIELAVQGVLQGGRLVVVGSTEIQFADFAIAQPRSALVLSIEDHGTLEFQLIFEKGSTTA